MTCHNSLIFSQRPTMCCSTKDPHPSMKNTRRICVACQDHSQCNCLVCLGVLREVPYHFGEMLPQNLFRTTFGSLGVLLEAIYHFCGLKTYLKIVLSERIKITTSWFVNFKYAFQCIYISFNNFLHCITNLRYILLFFEFQFMVICMHALWLLTESLNSL